MKRISRREFVARTLAASSTVALCGGTTLPLVADEKSSPPIVVFSKVYQELKLDFETASALTADAGLDGVDCPVRPGGEILPERVSEELPRYVEALHKRNLQMPLLTTAITSLSSARAEEIVRLAKGLGVQFYRLGFTDRKTGAAATQQLREIKAQLKDLAALNKEVGIGAIYQNHSPSGKSFVGGDLSELYDIVKDFNPAQIGAALHERFMTMHESGVMASPSRPAGMILELITGELTGQIADAGSRS